MEATASQTPERRERNRDYYEKNKELIRAKAREKYRAQKEEKKAYQRSYRETHLEECKTRSRRYYQDHRESQLAYHRVRKDAARERRMVREFGLSEGDREMLLKRQGGGCAICEKKDGEGRARLHVDHNHRTGVPRGLLCGVCNRGIGMLGDDVVRLRAAIKYLEAAEA